MKSVSADPAKAAAVASIRVVDRAMIVDRAVKAVPVVDGLIVIVDRAINKDRAKVGLNIATAIVEDTAAIATNSAAKVARKKGVMASSNAKVNVLMASKAAIKATDIRADNIATIKIAKVLAPHTARAASKVHTPRSVCRARWSIRDWEPKSAASSNASSAVKNPNVLSAASLFGDPARRQPPLGRRSAGRNLLTFGQ
jgi:hypothetical protein